VLLATALALGAAGLHTTWNLLLKTAPAEDRDLTSWGLFVVGGLLVLPVAILRGGPGQAALPWLTASALIHLGYVSGLVSAYRHGDFSLAYPLARGSGAMVAAAGGAAVFGDRLPVAAWVAIAVVAGGLVSLVGRGVSTTAVRDAVVAGVCIGCYTLVDVHGARVATDTISYGLLTTTGPAITLSVLFLARGRGPALRRALRAQWWRWAIAGVCTATAYAMVLVATRHAEVGYVAMLRESSVVFGALVGWKVLGEDLGARRLRSSLVVLAGMLALIVARLG
jgi:drug/metabolite transporter (DMT)-like permease